MSMLAEKKRREKWSLNPRGKAWSEDQNKFGQRLMEKMGWKAGQGLGVNSQGQTDIVKARVKNDSKGLGFKENGEEWLKTTSDFDNLLEELASSQEDSGDGSQSETPASLEDRSKKSRARVHYHKFTRGKDLSRYSAKDLASIIGPDVIKGKNEEESKSDYTQNQINKGSLEEYFNKKSKSKKNEQVDENTPKDDNVPKDSEENVKSKSKNKNEDIDNFNADPEFALDPEPADVVSPKKRKKRSKSNKNENEQNLNEAEQKLRIDNAKSENDHLSFETEVKREKKKRKIICDFENGTAELNENNLDISVLSKKVKKEKETVIETEMCEPPTDPTITECSKVSKKRKRKQEYSSESFIGDNVVSNEGEEMGIEGESKKKKKKKSKNKDEDIQVEMTEEQVGKDVETSTTSEQVVSQEKSGDFLEVLGRRTRLKNIKFPPKAPVDDTYQTEEFMSFDKSDGSKKEATKSNASSSLNIDDIAYRHRVNIYKKSNPLDLSITYNVIKFEDKLVRGKLNNYEKIKKPSVVITDSKNLSKDSVKRLETLHTVRYYKSFLSEKDICEIDATVKSFIEDRDLKHSSKVKCEKNDGYVKFIKSINGPEISEPVDSSFKCYIDPKDKDCDMPKHVVAYEYRLVTSRLKQLEIIPPDFKVIINESNKLSETLRRKLRQVAKIRHLKDLLPPDDVKEIEASVSKFNDDIKPRIEIGEVLTNLEEKLSEIATNLDGNADLKIKQGEAENVKNLLSENIDGLGSLFLKLELILENVRKTKEEPCSSKYTEKEMSDAEDTGDKCERRCVWLKRVEDKLALLKEDMKMLSEGKKPLHIFKIKRESQSGDKNKTPFQPVRVDKNHYQNTKFSRGRIAHNVSNQRGRGRGIGRASGVRSAVPSGGRGILKSSETRTEPGPADESLGGGLRRSRGSVMCGRGDYGGRGDFTWRVNSSFGARGNFVGQRRGGFGVGGDFMERGHGGSSFAGRGRAFSGRGGLTGRARGRGLISQANFDAKKYAEKCKVLNKVPDVCFNGVDLKVISGYAANVSLDKSKAPINIDSKSRLSDAKDLFRAVVKKEENATVNTTNKVPGEFSEVVVTKGV